MSDFSNAKVGDKVWDLLHGEGVIMSLDENCDIVVDFGDKLRSCVTYRLNGVMNNLSLNYERSLYHSKPTIIEAKRIVKKEIEVLINIGSQGHIKVVNKDFPHETIKAKLTFEVEE